MGWVATERGADDGDAAEDRRLDDVAVGPHVETVGEHRAVDLRRQARGGVAAVVGHTEEDEVGVVARFDLRCHRRARGHAHQRAAEVAGGEDLGGPVPAELAGDRVGVAPRIERLDLAAELSRLGEQLERERKGLAALSLGEHPRLAHGHVRSPSAARGTG